MCLVLFKVQGGGQNQYNYGGGNDPTTITAPPSSSFTIATTMTDDYETFEGEEAKESKEKA